MKAVEALELHAKKKGWVEKSFGDLYRPGTVELGAPIDKVARFLGKQLKPSRKVVSAIKFADGRVQEILEADFQVTKLAPAPKRETGLALVEEEPTKAVSVAVPTKGCPEPDFNATDVRARAVLMAFLSPEQRSDFLKYNRFVTFGATTGHRYMVISRHNREALARFGGRGLYDIDEESPICVHDYMVPAAEEMLALHMLVSLPGHEHYVRTLAPN